MAHAIERELIKVTNYKPRKKFDDRQDYLSSILNAVMKLDDAEFDNISDEAAVWANAAVEAHNSKDELPDFDEVEASEDDADDGADEEAEGEDAAEHGGDDDPDGTDDDVADSDSDDGAEDDDAEDDEELDPSDDEDEAEEDDEAEAAPAPKPAKASGKVVKAAPKKNSAPAKPKPIKKPKSSADDDVVLDKWGCMEGSKNSRALAMFEKGATAKEVKDSLGGTYYNILKKMTQEGHIIEKEGALIRVIHKDEKGKKAAPKKAPEKAPAKKGKK